LFTVNNKQFVKIEYSEDASITFEFVPHKQFGMGQIKCNGKYIQYKLYPTSIQYTGGMETRILKESELQFIDLIDVPETYYDSELKYVRVDKYAHGLIFDDVRFLDLADTVTEYPNDDKYIV